MARCYEFGVAVAEGCEHAMVVAAQGGACECHTCGARCLGKFSGCGEVIAQPGYVPATAPHWAVERGDPARPAGAEHRPTVAVVASPAGSADATILPAVTDSMTVAEALLVAVQSELGSVRTLLHALIERPEPMGREALVDAVRQIRAELDIRDAELKTAFDAMTAKLSELERAVVTDKPLM